MSSLGFEAEFFLVDSESKIQPLADKVLEKAKNTIHPPVKEYAKEVVELNVLPSEIVEGAVIDYVKALLELDEILRSLDLYLLPMAVYPLPYKPQVRRSEYYEFKKKVLGEKSMEYAARCTSFHFHYLLPADKKKIVSIYNLLVASVPVFDAFLQSSPYFEGRFIAKDTRAFLYRDMKIDGIIGAYTNTIFGGTAEYVKNFDELLNILKARRNKWKAFEQRYGVETQELLDYFWGTVRLNKVGTVELRSPDINLPTVLLEALHLFYKICRIGEEVEVVIGRGLSFSDLIELPSMDEIRRLEFLAAKEGLENEEVYNYVNKFMSAVGGPFIRLKSMMERKESFADILLKEAKRCGLEELPVKAAELMLEDLRIAEQRAIKIFAELENISRDKNPLLTKILEILAEPSGLKLTKGTLKYLQNIKGIVISPSVFVDSSLVKKLRRHLIVFTPLELGKDKIDRATVGLIEVLAKAKGLSLNDLALLTVSSEETDVFKFFGAIVTFNTADKKVKKEADLILENTTELLTFLGKKS